MITHKKLHYYRYYCHKQTSENNKILNQEKGITKDNLANVRATWHEMYSYTQAGAGGYGHAHWSHNVLVEGEGL